jgi:hypothetical protein
VCQKKEINGNLVRPPPQLGHQHQQQRQSSLSNNSEQSCPIYMNQNQHSALQQAQMHKNKKLAVTVDRVCRFLFPFSFMFFNLVYWSYYLVPRMYLV